MSKDKNRAERQAKKFLEEWCGVRPYFLAAQFNLRTCFTVNRQGFPPETLKEIQWLLEAGWIKRVRPGRAMELKPTPNARIVQSQGSNVIWRGAGGARRCTQMQLTQKGMNKLGIVETTKGYKLVERKNGA